MVEAYVRTASEIERMDDGAFFARFGEACRALRFVPDGANEARGPNARISSTSLPK